MTVEHAKTFLDRMDRDPKFAQRVAGFPDSASRGEFVRSEGMEFTIGELMEVVAASGRKPSEIGIDMFVSRIFEKQCIGIDCGN